MPTKRFLDFKDPLNLSDKKASKPLMEKRRRARINHSLAQIKSLIIDPNTTERSRQSKLEKADILELTVRHLHEINRRQRTVNLLDSRNPKRKFEVGYSECVREVDLFLSNLINPQTSSVDSELYKRLKQHLNRRLHDLTIIEPVKQPVNGEIGDVAITSSSKTADIQHKTVESNDLPETYSADIDTNSLPNSDDSKMNISECDTTANHLSIIQSPNTGVKNHTYRTDINLGHSHVSSSSSATEQTMISDDSDSYSSLSSPTNFYEHGESSRTWSVINPNVNQLNKCSSETNKSYSDEPFATESWNQNFKQIPLVPKHLPNGEWALVLPQNVSFGENEVHSFSAFRLVLPSNQSDSNVESNRIQNLCLTSPSSSSGSEMSPDEHNPRTHKITPGIVEHRENLEDLSSQCVWRPW